MVVQYQYSLPTRSSINLVKKLIQSNRKLNFFTLNSLNTPVLFLRSPKHFKRGKQIIFFFNKHAYITYKFSAVSSVLVFKKAGILFNFFKVFSFKFFVRDIFLSRVSMRIKVKIQFNGWCYIYIYWNKFIYFFIYFLNFNFYK